MQSIGEGRPGWGWCRILDSVCGATPHPSRLFASLSNAPPSPRRAALRRLGEGKTSYAAGIGGTGSTVTDLIFSIANRDVTFFNATAEISFL